MKRHRPSGGGGGGGSSFYRRVSPTSFYLLLARATTDAQATALVSGWLLNASHFCVAPAGDFDDSCYPPSPPTTPPSPSSATGAATCGGPAQLVGWSLAEYDHLPTVRAARAALAKQMAALVASQWRQGRFVCEAFSPKRGATRCAAIHKSYK